MASASGYDLNTIPVLEFDQFLESHVPCLFLEMVEMHFLFSKTEVDLFLLLRVLPLVMVVLFLLRFLLIR